MHLKMSANCDPFSSGLNVLMHKSEVYTMGSSLMWNRLLEA